VSVPGWWTKFYLHTRTAWAKNWHEGTVDLENTFMRELPVRMPPYGRDYDILTSALTGEQLFDEYVGVHIESVEPEIISRCVGDIEFLVEGKHLWRGSAAYLRGRKHKRLAVLPDMNGISVVFNMKDLPLPPVPDAEAKLTVWTHFGDASYPIRIVDTLNGVPCSNSAREGGFAVKSHTLFLLGEGDQNLRIDLSSPLPEAARQVKIIAQLWPIGTSALPPVTIENPREMPGRYFEGKMKLSAPDDLADEAVNGAPVKVGLSYRLSDRGEFKNAWANRAIIYYKTRADSRFKVKTEEIADLSEVITIVPPAEMAAAYPSLVLTPNNFAAKISGHDKIPLGVNTDWESERSKAILKLTRGQAETTEAQQNFETARCAGDLTINFSVTDKNGPTLPADADTVTLKKRISGCGN